MGLLVIYAVFVTLYAIGMTIEYSNLHGFKRGYEEGYTDAKRDECERDIQSFSHSESGDGVLVWKNNECCK